MKMKKHTILSLFAAGLLGVTSLGYAAQPDAAQPEHSATSAKEAGKKITDAADAIKNYTADKRDEAAKKAKAALDELDVRINALEERIDKNWDSMDKTAREQARSALKTLHEQRVQVAEWYGGLKNSSAKAWGHMKKGFSDSYRSLRHAWEKAEQDYREDGKK